VRNGTPCAGLATLAMAVGAVISGTALAARPLAPQSAVAEIVPRAVGAQAVPPRERYHPFQQGVSYRVEAVQDEDTDVLEARARLRYTNRSPDTLDRLYFHQYLNAFRPNSAWSRYDRRFGDRTFQELGPDDHAFERLTSFTVDGRQAAPVYPYAPDSTVFYVQLPRPLAPGDSLTADMAWTARLATEPRRQGRAGRHYNWAHWYPRIAVYGRDGWEYRPHIRPGEFNGEFGRYDVTLELAGDQVIGATGVPAEGDPGWAGAAVRGSEPPLYLRDHYAVRPAEQLGLLRSGLRADRKRIRWLAEDVHNFAWSVSPDYLYLGGRWQGKPIHLLWEPTSPGWNAERVMRQQKEALDWLAELFGEYAWPQITVTDRVERGATEFPMLYMTSGGAVVHETMHMVAHGILANNEWREGWLDEGLASFLSNWRREARGDVAEDVWGRTRERVAELDAAGRSEPVGLPAAEFSSFDMYQVMTYFKGALIFRMLRDMLGEDTFRDGLRAYYERFRFRQVTGADFQRTMEDVSGQDLGWFFRQWLTTTHTLDYRVGDVALSGSGGAYRLDVEVIRAGQAWMPVEVEANGQRKRLDGRERRQRVTFQLTDRPAQVVIDPDGSLLDVNRANNRRSVP
jgi:hypothetical protein